jgi:hypothetical protein
MPKGTKITSFFDARRRECFLQSWEHLKNTAGEARVKLVLSMPLLNQPLIAMPDAISKAYALMCEDRSNVARANLDIYCEGMTIQLFSTDESKSPAVSATGTTLQKFHMESAGEGEKRTLDLCCVVYVPANVNLRDWAWDHLHATFYLESTYSQTEMEFTDEAPPPEEDDETDPTDEENEEIDKASGGILDFDESDPEPVLQ